MFVFHPNIAVVDGFSACVQKCNMIAANPQLRDRSKINNNIYTDEVFKGVNRFELTLLDVLENILCLNILPVTFKLEHTEFMFNILFSREYIGHNTHD